MCIEADLLTYKHKELIIMTHCGKYNLVANKCCNATGNAIWIGRPHSNWRIKSGLIPKWCGNSNCFFGFCCFALKLVHWVGQTCWAINNPFPNTPSGGSPGDFPSVSRFTLSKNNKRENHHHHHHLLLHHHHHTTTTTTTSSSSSNIIIVVVVVITIITIIIMIMRLRVGVPPGRTQRSESGLLAACS